MLEESDARLEESDAQLEESDAWLWSVGKPDQNSWHLSLPDETFYKPSMPGTRYQGPVLFWKGSEGSHYLEHQKREVPMGWTVHHPAGREFGEPITVHNHTKPLWPITHVQMEAEWRPDLPDKPFYPTLEDNIAEAMQMLETTKQTKEDIKKTFAVAEIKWRRKNKLISVDEAKEQLKAFKGISSNYVIMRDLKQHRGTPIDSKDFLPRDTRAVGRPKGHWDAAITLEYRKMMKGMVQQRRGLFTCWVPKDKDAPKHHGYPTYNWTHIKERQINCHQLSWFYFHPGIKYGGHNISHLCCNKECCRPAHLRQETARFQLTRDKCLGILVVRYSDGKRTRYINACSHTCEPCHKSHLVVLKQK